MDYDYNYGCLRQSMERFFIKKHDILKALDIQDYTTLNKWVNGELPLNTNSILRFCNYFNIPISNFFFDQDGLPADINPAFPELDNDVNTLDSEGKADKHYSYNSGFLKEFMAKFHLIKRDILKALGTRDYISLNKWLNGDAPIHIKAMLRFCNYFNVPICSFFYEQGDIPCDFTPRRPGPDDQVTPAGECNRDKGILEIHVSSRDPESPEMKAAVEYGLKVRDTQIKKRNEVLRISCKYDNDPAPEEKDNTVNEPFVMTVSAEDYDHGQTVLRMKLAFLEEKHALEQELRQKEDELLARFEAERSRLLSIIENLQKEVARLSSL